jgi:alkanesulfonate monooxygenase SsuD/methylene tetrahydromethanopterin reductase-like flavin-dependent oxidoreductase (luciferase family)
LEEALQICLQMWSENEGPYEGKHYRLAETICQPPPVQQPRPSIMVGGSGERKTLRLVAQYADACNLFATGIDDIAHKLEVLQRHCDDLGRDSAEIEKTIIGQLNSPDDTDAFMASMEAYSKLGIQLVELTPRVPDPADWVARVTEQVVPLLNELPN